MFDLAPLKEKVGDLKVLCVEDEDDAREAFVDTLKQFFLNITTAKNGKEGIEKCMQESPDIIISDIKMPIMSGIEMVKEIEKISNSEYSLIFITASNDLENFAQAIELNADGFMLKPISKKRFVEILEKVVENISAKKIAAEYKKELENRVTQEVRKNIEAVKMLRQQSKLAQMGEIMNAIIHHWRQPLGVINQITQDIADSYNYGELSKAYVEESTEKILHQVRYMFGNIEDLRSFFKTNKTKKEFLPMNIFEIVMTFMKKQFLANDIDIKIVQKANSIALFGYPDEFKQVILSLLNNSKEAFLKKPNIKNKKIIIEISKDKEFVNVLIKDNAGGIEESILEHIFEPCCTTKSDEGAGIGLFVSKIIIENSFFGTISARNRDSGAEFLIKIKNNPNAEESE